MQIKQHNVQVHTYMIKLEGLLYTKFRISWGERKGNKILESYTGDSNIGSGCTGGFVYHYLSHSYMLYILYVLCFIITYFK